MSLIILRSIQWDYSRYILMTSLLKSLKSYHFGGPYFRSYLAALFSLCGLPYFPFVGCPIFPNYGHSQGSYVAVQGVLKRGV
jgi:hypothetical protein